MSDKNNTNVHEEQKWVTRPRPDHRGRFWVVLAHSHYDDLDFVRTSQFLGLFHSEEAAYKYLDYTVRIDPPNTEPSEFQWNKFQGWESADAFLEVNTPKPLSLIYGRPIGYEYASRGGCVEYVWIEEHDGCCWDVEKTESSTKTEKLVERVEESKNSGDEMDVDYGRSCS